MKRPVSSNSMATCQGMRFGNLMLAASATVPALISGRPKRAAEDARIRSQDSASSNPPPTAMPLTAAINGLFSPGSSWMPPNPPTP